MRNMILGFGLIVTLVLSILIIISISEKMIIKQEIKVCTKESLKNTMELWMINKNISEAELIDNFLHVFGKTVKTRCKYKFLFYSLDTNNGFIDVETIATYKYPIGKNKEVAYRKAMILD